MSVLKGALSYQRFSVGAEPMSAEEIVKKLSLFKFRPLHEKGEDKESFGWASYLSEYDHEKDLEIRDFLYTDKIILSMRYDSISLPTALLKALIKKSLAHYERDNNKKPDRTVKKEIEATHIQALRARVVPKTRIVEAIWCQKAQELKIMSRTASLVDRFVDLFQQSFLLKPIMRDFAHEAYFYAHAMHEFSRLEHLVHEPLFIAPIRIDVH